MASLIQIVHFHKGEERGRGGSPLAILSKKLNRFSSNLTLDDIFNLALNVFVSKDLDNSERKFKSGSFPGIAWNPRKQSPELVC